MDLRSPRTYIRTWRRQDDQQADEWPPYDDPLDALWNLPRQLTTSSSQWYSGFDSGSMRRAWAVEGHNGLLM